MVPVVTAGEVSLLVVSSVGGAQEVCVQELWKEKQGVRGEKKPRLSVLRRLGLLVHMASFPSSLEI